MADTPRGWLSSLYEQIALVSRALGNPKRLALLDVLAQGERPVELLARVAGLSAALTSAHLQALRHAGLVTSRRRGTRVYYRLAGADVADLYVRVQAVAVTHLPVVAQLAEELSDFQQVTNRQLMDRISGGGVAVLDVRPVEEHLAGHIPGAISAPSDELANRLGHLPRDLDLVVCGRQRYCALAAEAVRVLVRNGVAATLLLGGMVEWRLAGLPVAQGHQTSNDLARSVPPTP